MDESIVNPFTPDQVRKLRKYSESDKFIERAIAHIAPCCNFYGMDEDRAMWAISSFPSFVNHPPSETLSKLMRVYGVHNGGRIKDAIFRRPSFLSYAHERVLWQKRRFGRFLGLTKDEVIECILDHPSIASYSSRRDRATVEVIMELLGEGLTPSRDQVLKCISSSPYVGKRSGIKISDARKAGTLTAVNMPDMYEALRDGSEPTSGGVVRRIRRSRNH